MSWTSKKKIIFTEITGSEQQASSGESAGRAEGMALNPVAPPLGSPPGEITRCSKRTFECV